MIFFVHQARLNLFFDVKLGLNTFCVRMKLRKQIRHLGLGFLKIDLISSTTTISINSKFWIVKTNEEPNEEFKMNLKRPKPQYVEIQNSIEFSANMRFDHFEFVQKVRISKAAITYVQQLLNIFGISTPIIRMKNGPNLTRSKLRYKMIFGPRQYFSNAVNGY